MGYDGGVYPERSQGEYPQNPSASIHPWCYSKNYFSKKRTSSPRPFVFIVLIVKTFVQNGGRVWNFTSVYVSAFLGRSSVLKQKNISCVDNPHYSTEVQWRVLDFRRAKIPQARNPDFCTRTHSRQAPLSLCGGESRQPASRNYPMDKLRGPLTVTKAR